MYNLIRKDTIETVICVWQDRIFTLHILAIFITAPTSLQTTHLEAEIVNQCNIN